MHRSRVGVFLIDHPEESYDAAAAFWAGATGSERPERSASGNGPYESLAARPGGELLELQRTGRGTPARIHLDVETDDVRAEVARVLGLGATVLEDHEDYVVLADPGGLPFCVVPVQTGDHFDRHAQVWD